MALVRVKIWADNPKKKWYKVLNDQHITVLDLDGKGVWKLIYNDNSYFIYEIDAKRLCRCSTDWIDSDGFAVDPW